jgi:hypothetical protein
MSWYTIAMKDSSDTLGTQEKETYLRGDWKTVMMAVVILLIGLVGSFVLIRRNVISRVTAPPVTSDVSTSTFTGYHIPSTGQVYPVTENDIKNAYLVIPQTARPLFFVPSNERKIHLENGVGTFAYCEGSLACQGNEIRNATATISVITVMQGSDSISPLSLNTFANPTGAMVIKLTFPDAGGLHQESYLAFFNYISSGPDLLENTIYTSLIKDIGFTEGVVTHIDITPQEEVVLTMLSKTDTHQKTFLYATYGRYGDDLIELSQDKTKKILENTEFGYRFMYPVTIKEQHFFWSPENQQLEAVLNKSPIYFANECGLQPSFADTRSSFWISEASGTVSLSANLEVHRISKAKTVYLTSALYGYNPSDWGKITETVRIQDYLDAITSGETVADRDVALETIHGYQVRHIKPFSSGRPCDTDNREEYQWVKGDLLFSLFFTESKYNPASNSQKSTFLDSLFSTLEVR